MGVVATLAWAWSVAWAEPLVLDLPQGMNDAEAYDELLERYEGVRAAEPWYDSVLVRRPSGRLVTLRSLQPGPAVAPIKEPMLRSAPVVHVGRTDGGLSGKAVYVSQCHGWMYFDSLARFSTQRGVLHETVEDFHNPEGANAYLIPYLENAGAMVYTARERDLQSNMAIADNDGSGYFETGSTFQSAGDGFKERANIPYGANPFSSGTSRRFRADSGDVAAWYPEVPEAGHYAIYVSWKSSQNAASDAHYRITYPGGVIDRYFDQRVHGSTWQYVETLYLEEGSGSVVVELIGDSSDLGTWVSTDAVRVGGGMAEVQREGSAPPVARWEVSGLQYAQYNGAPPGVYDAYGDGNGVDHVSRSLWADWEHPAGEDAMYISWHSNASANGPCPLPPPFSPWTCAPRARSRRAPCSSSRRSPRLQLRWTAAPATRRWRGRWSTPCSAFSRSSSSSASSSAGTRSCCRRCRTRHSPCPSSPSSASSARSSNRSAEWTSRRSCGSPFALSCARSSSGRRVSSASWRSKGWDELAARQRSGWRDVTGVA